MNPIQKAWLVVLRPVITLVNDKLAKRSGLIGKVGRFWSFGPRQFGYHPINRWFAYVNQQIIINMGLSLHRYSFMKGLTMNGFNYFRPHKFAALLGPFLIMYNFIYMALPENANAEDGTTFDLIHSSFDRAPTNALNNRVSAHYTEINDMYCHEMLKKSFDLQEKIIRERSQCDDQVKKTRYSRPGYQYIKAHSQIA